MERRWDLPQQCNPNPNPHSQPINLIWAPRICASDSASVDLSSPIAMAGMLLRVREKYSLIMSCPVAIS